MKNKFFAAMLWMSAASLYAAPVVNAPLATPVLVDSTGKVMGRYVNNSVLLTINGDVIAVPLRPRTVTIQYTAEVNSAYNYSSRPPLLRDGLDWQEGVIVTDANSCSVMNRPYQNFGWETAVRYSVPAVTLTRVRGTVFLAKPVFSMEKFITSASAYLSVSSSLPLSKNLPSSPVAVRGSFNCDPVDSSFITTTSSGGLAKETALISLDEIGIPPFYVK